MNNLTPQVTSDFWLVVQSGTYWVPGRWYSVITNLSKNKGLGSYPQKRAGSKGNVLTVGQNIEPREGEGTRSTKGGRWHNKWNTHLCFKGTHFVGFVSRVLLDLIKVGYRQSLALALISHRVWQMWSCSTACIWGLMAGFLCKLPGYFPCQAQTLRSPVIFRWLLICPHSFYLLRMMKVKLQ